MSKKILFLSLLALLAAAAGHTYFSLTWLESGMLGVAAFLLSAPFVALLGDKRQNLSTEVVEKPSGGENEAYRLLEKKFRAASEKAEKLEHEKKMTELFLASMSHEIRTPLNGIIGLTEVLDGTELNAEQKEFVSLIRDSSDNLRVIVNDILEISKLNSGKMELECIPFDVVRKIESSVGLFAPRFEEKQIRQSVTIDPKIPHEVKGDPTRLSQVITNLVSNAIKFTEPGGSIDVSAQFVESKEGRVVLKIAVKDSGIGLSKEQQEKIFDAYAQASASTTRKAGGTGLGLTISQKIVRSMGGELAVESEEGKGATFYFTVALKESEKPAALETPAEEQATVELEAVESETAEATEAEAKPLEILVAEDNPINQKLIRIVLEKFGLNVTLANNGEEALEARKANCYDMIFMDVQMPVMGGVEATHKILEYEKENDLAHVPIIALTANALAGDREKYIGEGMDDYATKPLDVKVIENLVEKYCG